MLRRCPPCARSQIHEIHEIHELHGRPRSRCRRSASGHDGIDACMIALATSLVRAPRTRRRRPCSAVSPPVRTMRNMRTMGGTERAPKVGRASHSRPIRAGPGLRRCGRQDGLIALVCVRSRRKAVWTPRSCRRRPYFAPGCPYFACAQRCEACNVCKLWRPAAGGAGPPRGSDAATLYRDPHMTIGLPTTPSSGPTFRDTRPRWAGAMQGGHPGAGPATRPGASRGAESKIRIGLAGSSRPIARAKAPAPARDSGRRRGERPAGAGPDGGPLRGLCPILWCVQPQKRHFVGIFIVSVRTSETINYGKSCQDRHA
jgi:hypothetical protein